MASIPCAIYLYPLPPSSSTPPARRRHRDSSSPTSSSLAIILSALGLRRLGKFRVPSWLCFGRDGVNVMAVSGSYHGPTRDDFDHSHVEQYFKCMGMLAEEGSYEKLEALLSQGIHPVDVLLIMAISNGDKRKIKQLLRAGASFHVKDAEGRTAMDKASRDEIRDYILRFSM